MFIYDNFDFSDYLLVRDIGRPILPPQKLYYTNIFGRNSAYFFMKEHKPVILPVEVSIFEDSNMTYRQMVRFLGSKLNKSKPKKLIFLDEPNMFIKGIIDDTTDLNNLVKAGQGVISFFCPDPLYYEINDEIFTFNSTGKHTVTRLKGNTESLPLIEIKGTNKNGIITIKTDYTTINYDGVLNKGETLVLDSNLITSYIVKSDGEKISANDDIDTMNFPYLEMGDNSFEFTVKDGATITEISIIARSRWT